MNTTEVVALITATGTLLAGFGAVWLKDRYDRLLVAKRERLASYERLSVATRVLALRAVVFRDRGSLPSVLAETMQEHTNFLPTLLLVSVPKIREKIGVSGALAVARSIPAPRLDPPAATLGSITEAFEEVIAAASAVHVRGRPKALEAADALLMVSGEFVDFVMAKPPVRKRKRMPPVLDQRLEAINLARQHFLEVVREEDGR